MDLYVVLGVGRGASPADLKRAYRRLARRHHPDLNPGDREADVRFQRIVSAYETLIDPERRRRYDAGERDPASPPPAPGGSFGFAGFDFSAASASDRRTTFGELFEDVLVRRGHGQARGGERGADLVVRASLSFADAWRGCGWPAMLTRQVACPSCNGWGE